MFNFDVDFIKCNNFCLAKLKKLAVFLILLLNKDAIYKVFNSYLFSIGIVRYNPLHGA